MALVAKVGLGVGEVADLEHAIHRRAPAATLDVREDQARGHPSRFVGLLGPGNRWGKQRYRVRGRLHLLEE